MPVLGRTSLLCAGLTVFLIGVAILKSHGVYGDVRGAEDENGVKHETAAVESLLPLHLLKEDARWAANEGIMVLKQAVPLSTLGLAHRRRDHDTLELDDEAAFMQSLANGSILKTMLEKQLDTDAAQVGPIPSNPEPRKAWIEARKAMSARRKTLLASEPYSSVRVTVPHLRGDRRGMVAQIVSVSDWWPTMTPHEARRVVAYEDLRRKGYTLIDGIKFGADFSIYAGDIGSVHSCYLVRVVAAGTNVMGPELAAAARVSTFARKISVLAVVDVAGSVEYVQLEWMTRKLPRLPSPPASAASLSLPLQPSSAASSADPTSDNYSLSASSSPS